MSRQKAVINAFEEFGFKVKPNKHFMFRNNMYKVSDGLIMRNNNGRWLLSPLEHIMEIIAFSEEIKDAPPYSDLGYAEVKLLKALYTLGFRYLVKNRDGSMYAIKEITSKLNSEWFVTFEDEAYRIDTASYPLVASFCDYTDDTPLKIEAIFKANNMSREEYETLFSFSPKKAIARKGG